MAEADRARRHSLFQKLKPCCVRLSQQALKDGGTTEDVKALRGFTSTLLAVLQKECTQSDSGFDEKLADYAFFPLSHVLRKCQKVPGRLAELAVQCLKILLQYGWRSTIGLDLALQLLLLLTFFCGGSGAPSPVISEELKTESYGALGLLFDDLRNTPKGSASLTEAPTIPALGGCLSAILDGITDGPTPQCQIEALNALRSLWKCVGDIQALSTFLPGTISALTKALLPTTGQPRSTKVIIASLNVLQIVISTCLGDLQTRNLKDEEEPVNAEKPTKLTKAWLKATASQVKLALATVVKLRKSRSADVQRALSLVCLALLDECHVSLAEAAPLLVETAMHVSEEKQESADIRETSLRDLAMIHGSVADLIKTTVYDWVTSFPRIMQSSDEIAKGAAMQQLSKAYRLVSELSLGSGVLEDAITDSLRGGIVSIVGLSSTKHLVEETTLMKFDTSLILSHGDASTRSFRPILMPHESQIQTRSQLEDLMESIGSPELQVRMAYNVLARVNSESGPSQIASFWLSFQLLKASTTASKMYDDFLDSSLTAVDDQDQVAEELYDHALNFLSQDGLIDWRLQALSLEIVAYQANALKSDFRSDLIDALYPIVQLLGSHNNSLRGHAIASLNVIASACDYNSTSSMIVENVDYLVNAVSLKLNTFDISPQAPQVLVMMLKLCGPSLLPYLDDVVGSIFAALDNFHGYPRLVESLFAVLGEIVQEGNNSSHLRIESGASIDHEKKADTGPPVDETAQLLQKSISKVAADQDMSHEDFPNQPWKSATELLDQADSPEETSEEEEEDADPRSEEKSQEIAPTPPTKVYTMLQSIARLSQHYLTSQSPMLRQRLLSLITTASTALYADENEFLPLVNDVWPVLIKRLYDTELNVVIAAANSISEVCRCAGDFMATRIQTEWLDLVKLAKHLKTRAAAESKGPNARGVYALNSQVWEAIADLFVSIVKHVRINDAMFDEVLQLLKDLIGRREDVRLALESVNADAVWLARFEETHSPGDVPVLAGFVFVTA